MMRDPSETVGAPTELADEQEVPDWVENTVKALSAGPILIGFICGGLPTLLAICWCISQILL